MNEYKARWVQADGFAFQPSVLQGVRWTKSDVHNDDRGYFLEAYRERFHRALTGDYAVQTNVSVSKPMVLRGFHWHREQWDIWTIASGMAQVVLISGDETEGRVLSTGQGVIIPTTVAHGFLALSDLVLIYSVTAEFERAAPDEQGFSAKAYGGWLTDDIDKTIRSERDVQYDTTHRYASW
jgi:dTDP-4-dehydrorhamnose 3,5-epimerase